jgi:maltokinase
MPPYFGAFVDRDLTMATVTGFVPGALDGWDWYVDELTAGIHGGDIGVALHSAALLGGLTARLHNALAQPSTVIPSPIELGSLDGEADRAEELLAEATGTIAGDDVVAPRAGQIASLIGGLRHRPATVLQPVHGDLHVGQILRAGTSLSVNDFDGSPVADHAERLRPRSRLVDLASMLQSIDHVGRVVVNRRPVLAGPIEEFISEAVTTALNTYADGLDATVATDGTALFALRVIQELHELVYASRSLPRWRYVPEAAIAALLPDR